MKTKIVYAVTSDNSDIYLEQTYVSICSLRRFHPDATVILVVDDKTNNTITGKREYILEVVTEKIVVIPPQEYTKVERSRYLKTTIRSYIEGDYLFIDSDTVICDDLSDVDNFDGDICAVLDYHLPLKEHHFYDNFIKAQAQHIEWTLRPSDTFFNSGVMYVRDNPRTHMLYQHWNQEWMKYRGVKYVSHADQPFLGKVNSEMEYVIKEIDGKWNCQIAANGLRYFYNAKILHYFSSTIRREEKEHIYVLMNNKVFSHLKKEGSLDDYLKQIIESPKREFAKRLMLISGTTTDVFCSNIVRRIFYIHKNHHRLYKILDFLCKIWNK